MSRTPIALTVVMCATLVSGGAAQRHTTAPPGQQAKRLVPSIAAVTPSAPRGPVAQLLTVTGINFAAGLSITVVAPDEQTRTYAGPAVRSWQETRFQVAVVLGLQGAYAFTVTNPDGAKSDAFVLTARAPALTPRLDAVLPTLLTTDPHPQMVTINGDRFAAGLSISLTDPIGTVFLINGSALGSVTATSIEASLTLAMIGDYFLRVTNPDGGSSNDIRLAVTMRKR